MAEAKLEITFIEAEKRLVAAFTGDLCHGADRPPDELFVMARERMERELSQGQIEQYLIFEDRFRALWQVVRDRFTLPEARFEEFNLTLAVGGPQLGGLIVMPPEDDKAVFNITFDLARAELKRLPYSAILLHIALERRRQRLAGPGNPAQLQAALLRALQGQKILNLPIHAKPPTEADGSRRFRIIGNRGRKEAILVVNDHMLLRDQTGIELILKGAADAVRKMTISAGEPYHILAKELLRTLKQAADGAERVGLDMPLVLLVGTGEVKAAVAEETKTVAASAPPSEAVEPSLPKPKAPSEAVYAGFGELAFEIAEDKMTARIGRFDLSLYQRKDMTVDTRWVQREAKRYGIVFGMRRSLLGKLAEAISRRKDLTGMVVATGEAGQAGTKPYLFASYKKVNEPKGQEAVSVREQMRQESVRAGEKVAEVRYASGRLMGRDVLGREFEPEGSEPFEVKVGTGIEERSPGQFYATMDGMPLIEGQAIRVSDKLIVRGDVNLKTGNIYYDGSAEIDGAIDTGATVIVTGDLLVTGTIRSAYVRGGGNLEAKGGIVTTDKGRVHVGGNIRADYVENSNIICGGNLFVERALINSHVITGGAIEVDKTSGTLAGGEVSCKQFIRTAKLGFPKGNVTRCNVGVDWRVELSVRIRKRRIEKLEAVNAENRMALRELVRKRKEQMTAKHREKIDELQKRLQRERNVLDAMTRHLERAESMLTWDKDARIYVHDTLTTNVKLKVGGATVHVSHDIAGVMLTAQKRRGSHIVALQDVDKADVDKAG